jgi:hypothetical protein
MIYLIFRPLSIKLFGIFTESQLNVIIDIREKVISLRNVLPKWVIYSLSDGLWLFSFSNLIILIFKNSNFIFKRYIYLVPLLFAIIYEFLQWNKLRNGTFDIVDIIFYILFYFLSLKMNDVILFKYEKNK